tara:strand:- start:109 stop:675 length:567 start_codon:yes stop_codon:yes gene_type:complete
MRLFIAVLVLIFSIQSWTKADDISDFEIEGMSIGDSALDYFSENEISEAMDESYEDREYLTKTFYSKNSNLYEAIQIIYKSNDKNKIIVGIVGAIWYPNNINKCKKQMYEISSELTDLFPETIKKDWGKYENNKSQKKGHYFPITFDFAGGSTAMISCHDWNEETGLDDSLKISLFEAKYSQYLEQKN